MREGTGRRVATRARPSAFIWRVLLGEGRGRAVPRTRRSCARRPERRHRYSAQCEEGTFLVG